MKASIIIVTRDRATDLKQTIQSLEGLSIPDGVETELIVVDNGSADGTREVVASSELTQIPIRYLFERRQGKCHGLNRALFETMSEIVLFTDDDVRLDSRWLCRMVDTLMKHKPCAVAGGVKLAPHLLRPWMTPKHRSWLASTEWLNPTRPESLVGANMAFSREILGKVPEFDPELGPGASGFGDEELFALQLVEAGFPIVACLDINVEHHFEPTRLARNSWIQAATRRARSHAYLGHHWNHWPCRFPKLRLVLATCKLEAWRRHSRKEEISIEGCGERELDLIYQVALIKAHMNEQVRPRNYERCGLVKISKNDLS